MHKGKIVIVGDGFVGSTIAFSVLKSGLFAEIMLIDLDRDKAEGDALDMMHGISFVNTASVYAGDYSDCKDADVVVITAGAAQAKGETRHDLLIKNASIFKNITTELIKYINDDTKILVVTNPVDVLTYVTLKISGMDKSCVIGSGTVLDTSRLKYELSKHTGISPKNIHSYILGEHGDSEIAAFSTTSIAGMTVSEFCGNCKKCSGTQINQILDNVKYSAYDIINKKGATYYAVALAVERILSAIIDDENSILTVSSLLTGEYGLNDVALSAPSVVNRRGVDRIIEIPLSDSEREGLFHSADTLKQLLKELKL